VQQSENEQIRPDSIYDTACLCEAVCLMIRICQQLGVKNEADSLRDCIKHLELGFIDETYKVRTTFPKQARLKCSKCGALTEIQHRYKDSDPWLCQECYIGSYCIPTPQTRSVESTPEACVTG